MGRHKKTVAADAAKQAKTAKATPAPLTISEQIKAEADARAAEALAELHAREAARREAEEKARREADARREAEKAEREEREKAEAKRRADAAERARIEREKARAAEVARLEGIYKKAKSAAVALTELCAANKYGAAGAAITQYWSIEEKSIQKAESALRAYVADIERTLLEHLKGGKV